MGKLYAVGGEGDFGTIHSVERFDPVTGTWDAVAPLAAKRSRMGVVVLRGELYAVGGDNGWDFLSSVERFSPDAGEWSEVPSMRLERHGLGALALAGQLYAIGGYGRGNRSWSVERLETQVGTTGGGYWRKLPQLADARKGVTMLARGNAGVCAL